MHQKIKRLLVIHLLIITLMFTVACITPLEGGPTVAPPSVPTPATTITSSPAPTLTATPTIPRYTADFVRDNVFKAISQELIRRGWDGSKIGAGYSADSIGLRFIGKADPEIVNVVQAIIDAKAPGLALFVEENTQRTPLTPSPLLSWQTEILDELHRLGVRDRISVSFSATEVELVFKDKSELQVLESIKTAIERIVPGMKVVVTVREASVGIPPWYNEVYDELKRQGIIDKLAWMHYSYSQGGVLLAFTGKADQQIIETVRSMITQKAPDTNLIILENQIRI